MLEIQLNLMTTRKPCRKGFYLNGQAIAYQLLACMVFFGLSVSVQASHVSGVDISYECINSCTIRVNFRGFRDCSSSITNLSPVNTLTITADSGCTPPTQITGWVNGSNIEVTPVCPGTPTLCNTPGATINGIMEHYWTADFDFCAANCSTYTIGWQTCCRNSNINTLFQPAATGIYASTTVNPFLTPCNSSPQFTNPPLAYICQNQSYIFSQGANDPDGDSLAYLVGPCMRNDSDSVAYLPFTSATQPLGPDWIVSLDSITGNVTVAPDPNGPNPGSIYVGVLCIYVQEWRNGQLINTIVRDMQITVIPCPANTSPYTNGVSQISGGTDSAFTITTCLGATVCADLRFLDPDPGQTQTVWWDMSLAPLGATFVAAGNPSVTDTIVAAQPTARFCWTPTAPGTYTFGVTVIDDFCPTYGINQYTYTVEVGQIDVWVDDSTSGCDSVIMCALPQSGTWPYSYQWSGSGGINVNPNNADSCFNHQFPFAGNYPYTLTLTDAIGCVATASDTVVIPNNVQANAGPDLSTCSNQPTVIGIPAQTNPNLAYTWSPLFGLSNPNNAQPTATISNNTSAPTSQSYVLQLRDTMTKCFDLDTMQLTIFPVPNSQFYVPPQTCQGVPIAVTYTGTNGPFASYNWTFSGGNPSTGSGPGPIQVLWNQPGFHEITLTVTENGCSSPVQRDTIFVKPIPVATIAGVSDQCLIGNSFNFQNVGSFGNTATFQWTFWPNATPSTSTSQNANGIVFSTPGPKIAVLQISENGCNSVPDTLHFQVNPDPNPNWSVQSTLQCFTGNSFQFQTAGNNDTSATYSWTFSGGNPSSSTDSMPVVTYPAPGPKVVTLVVSQNGCTASRTDTVYVVPEPTVQAGPAQSFCEGEGGVTLLATASSGTAPYYYSWWCPNQTNPCGIDSVNDNDPTVNPGGTTMYYVQITDANGCSSAIDSVLVTVLPKPLVDAGPDVSVCGANAPCVVLNPGVSGPFGPYTYQWLPGTGLNDSTILNPCARPDSTTIYALVVTDLGTGCTSDFNTLDTLSTVQVTVEPVPVADAGTDISLCEGDSAILDGVGTGAGPDYQYQWSPTTGLDNPFSANPYAFPAFTTQYTLVVWSNGCPSLSDTVNVAVHTNPTVDAGADREICLGESVTLNATVGGDSTAVYTFNWASHALGNIQDPTIEDPTAVPNATTTYYVTAVSNWGCSSSTDSVTIFLRPTPIAEAGPDLQICIGDSAHLDGSYSYGLTDSVPDSSQIWFAWSPPLHMTDSSEAKPGIQPPTSIWYHLQVRHADCITVDSVLVTVIPDLNATATADTTVICSGDSIQLNAGGGLGSPQYIWTPATGISDPRSGSPMVAPDSAITYTLMLFEAGCADTTSFSLDVLPTPDASFVHSQATGCPPLDMSFLETSEDGIHRIWDFGDGSPISNEDDPRHQYSDPGQYSVQMVAVGQGGCTDTADVLEVTVLEQPRADFSTTPSLPANLYLPDARASFRDQSTDAVWWRWDFGDGLIASSRNPDHRYTEPGEYTVRLLVANSVGCQTEISKGTFLVLAPDLFIPNVFTPNGDGISDRFLVEYSGDQPFSLQILDRWGKSLHNSNNKLQGWNGLDQKGRVVAEGVYFYRVSVGGKDYAGEVTLMR